jgi:hypothetical protein
VPIVFLWGVGGFVGTADCAGAAPSKIPLREANAGRGCKVALPRGIVSTLLLRNNGVG